MKHAVAFVLMEDPWVTLRRQPSLRPVVVVLAALLAETLTRE